MSDSLIEDDDDRDHADDGHVNGNITDDDIRALLAKERERTRALQLEVASEKTKANRAEAIASRAEATATSQQTARLDAEDQAVAARLEGAEAAALGIKRELAQAFAEGKFEDAAELQDKLTKVRQKQQADQQYKAWLESERTRQAAAPPPRQVDQSVDLTKYSAAQQDWIRRHPEFITDLKMQQRTVAGHQLALAEGYDVDSPEYFAIIDETVNSRKRAPARTADGADDAGDDGDETVAAPVARRRAPPEIPVTRNNPRTTETRRQEVNLSALEKEAADITMPDVPVQGEKDAKGNWVPGRYEKYAMHRQKLKQRNGG